MATAQRKRKSGLRQPNGRLRQPSKTEREEFAKRMERVEMQTVLDQPHRRGKMDQGCECALGRLFLRNNQLRRELKDSAEHYRDTRRRWQSAWGAPTLDCIEGGNGNGPSDRLVRQWAKDISEMEHEIVRVCPLSQFQQLVCEEIDIKPEYEKLAILAMIAIAKLTGRLGEKCHPFER